MTVHNFTIKRYGNFSIKETIEGTATRECLQDLIESMITYMRGIMAEKEVYEDFSVRTFSSNPRRVILYGNRLCGYCITISID